VTDIEEGLGAVRLRDLTPLMIERFYAERSRTGGRKGTGLSPKSIRNHHVTLRKALADAERLEVIDRNPAPRAKAPSAVRPQTRTWTTEELGRFLRHAPNDPLFALWVLLATTGMRQGEAVGLRWSDVDLDRCTVSVNQSVTTVGTKVIFSPPKERPQPAAPGPRPRHSPHPLDVHPKVISDRLGHSTISITIDTYSHAIPGFDVDAAATVASQLFTHEEDEGE